MKMTFEQIERKKFIKLLALLIGLVGSLFLILNYSFYSLRKKEHLQIVNNLIEGTLKAHQGQLATELFLNQATAYQLRVDSLTESLKEFLLDPKICIQNNSNLMITPNTKVCKEFFGAALSTGGEPLFDAEKIKEVFPIQDGNIIVGKIGIIYRDAFSVGSVVKKYKAEILFILFSFLVLIVALLFVLNQYMKKIFLKLKDTERVNAFNHIATQVAHDIRSPLAVLDYLVTKAFGLSKEKEVLFKQAVARVRDIANHLLETNKKDKNRNTDSLVVKREIKAELLSTLIDPLITEKRYQYANRLDIEFEMEQTEASYGLFAKVEEEGFKRVLSNIIDNAVEAIEEKGRVSICLSSQNDHVLIKIQDNGKGILPEHLPKILEEGESYGKENGFGLGLPYAKEMVEKWGGKIKVESKLNQGTTVILSFPKEASPEWFVSELKITPRLKILILDDDSSIHSIWSRRFNDLFLSNHQVEIFSFTEAKSFIEKVNHFKNKNIQFLCLMDQDLLDPKQTGLDLIKEHDLSDKSILVTSRFEEKEVVSCCQEREVKLLPKGLAGFIPIKFVDGLIQNPDVVLIDDSDMVHNLWKLAAQDSGKRVLTLKSEEELNAHQLDRTTPIYVDKNLEGEISGFDVVRSLYEQGYTNLYIATGEFLADMDPKLPFLRGITGKEFPVKVVG